MRWPFSNKQTTNSTSTVSFREVLGSVLGLSHNGLRSLYAIFGYKPRLKFIDYLNYYRRQDYANRMVAMIPKSCWRDGAELVDEDEIVIDEDMMRDLAKTGIYQGLERADILNRLGRFSIMVVGVPDGMNPDQEIGRASPERLDEVFYSAFSEDGIIINKWETDVMSNRYGLPVEYTVQMVDHGEKEQANPLKAFTVHWSRVVHMAEGALDNDVEGFPFLEPVVNRLDDLNKTIGGAAEAYFRNARGKFALETKDGFDGVLDEAQVKALRDEADAFQNNWRDHMRLTGVTAHVLNTPTVDPKGVINGAIQALSGYSGIPIRILTGEGAGQLAGNEDKASYNQMISDRQSLVCTSWLNQVLEILVKAGMITRTEGGVIQWPDLKALDEGEQAVINVQKATAFKTVTDALDSMTLDGNVDPADVYKEILGIDLDIEENDDDEETFVDEQQFQEETQDEAQGTAGA